MDVSLVNPRRRVGTIVGRWFVTKADVGYRQERDPAQRLRPRRQPTLIVFAKAHQVQRLEIIEQSNLLDFPEPSFEPYQVYTRQGLCPELLTLTFNKISTYRMSQNPSESSFPNPTSVVHTTHHASKGTGFTGSKLAILASSDIGSWASNTRDISLEPSP